MPKKLFNVVEINRMIPFLKSTAREILELTRDVRDLEGARKARGTRPLDQDILREKHKELRKCFADLAKLGCEVRNVDPRLKEGEAPLLDFPAVLDGREVYLCWQYGEESVEYWHELESGFAGRKRLAVRV